MKALLIVATMSLLALSSVAVRADQVAVLGTADSFAVLGASTVTNTGASVLSGNLGLYAGTSITGFAPGKVVNGTTYTGSGPASTAQSDAMAGYTHLAGLAPTHVLTGQDLGGLTLGPGVYFFASSAELTGALTLDFQNSDGADIVFQIGSTLTTASDSDISIINQGLDDNVYYQVGSSATLGTGTQFQGDILALASVTLNTGADITCGSAIALTAAVTLDDNTITNCSTTGSDVTPAASTPSATPEPSGLLLLATALLAGAAVLRHRLVA